MPPTSPIDAPIKHTDADLARFVRLWLVQWERGNGGCSALIDTPPCLSGVRDGMAAVATRLEAQAARIAEMESALAPFGKCSEQIDAGESDDEWAKFRLLIGDYRRAALALAVRAKT